MHTWLWGLIHLLAGARSGAILNRDAPATVPPWPDQALYRAAQEVKSISVDEAGKRVDYAGLSQSPSYQKLREITGALPLCQLEDLGDEADRLAFWINLYNSLILDAVVCYGIEGGIPLTLFQRAAYNVCGRRFSADDIEHGVLRGNRPHPVFWLRPFGPHDPRQRAVIDDPDPRIHFALNCGARSCPPVDFYQGEKIEGQLELATRSFVQSGGVEVSPKAGVLRLSQIFRWYQGDFGGRQGVLDFVADHWWDSEEADLIRSGNLRLEYLPYDWSVNALRTSATT